MPLKTKVRRCKLTTLSHSEKNARYMDAIQFNRLVANLEKDGTLTSLPLVIGDRIISGHHRVDAAIAAGIEEADVVEVISKISEGQIRALQTSHNAIVGKDDLGVLREIYDSLDFDEKVYSGLTDDLFEVEELDLQSLPDVPLDEVEISISFLPEDKDAFDRLIDRAKKGKTIRFVAAYKDFDDFFDAMVRIKEGANITNVAMAFRHMIDLATERFDQLQGEEK